MKFSALLLIFGILEVTASVSYSQETKISIELENATISKLLREIREKSEFNFWYANNVIDNNQRVTVKVKDQTVDKILDIALKEKELTYEIKGKIIYIAKKGAEVSGVMQQEKTISGVVTDAETGTGLPGVNVLVEGTMTGVITDPEGRYEITVPNENAVLVFSFIGYLTEKVVANLDIINIGMVADITSLDEVVVVGYGQQKNYTVVGAVTSIKPDLLQRGTNRSLSNNLAGQLSGVIAVQRSGEPGYDNSNFWIRGISTFASGKDPLVLIDGIERSLNNIDPAEIESFSILKDASASAVYGVRGANGVILINTKRGKEGRPEVEFRFEQGYTQPVKLPKFIGAAEYLEVFNSIAAEGGATLPYQEERIENIRNQTDPDLYPDINWLDEITNDKASNSRANLTVSGGNEFLRYCVVTSVYDEKGIIARDPEQEWNSSLLLRRYNMRTNVDLNLTPTTLMRVNIGGFLEDGNKPPQSIDYLFEKAFETPPYLHPTKYSSGEIPRVSERVNPWALATQTGYERNSGSKIESLFSVEQDLKTIVPGLKAKLNFSFDRYSQNRVTRKKDPDYYTPATSRYPDSTLNLSIASYGQEFLGHERGSEWGNRSVYLEGQVSYMKYFGDHLVDALFLYNQRNYDDGSALPFRNQGIAGRLSYSYDRRYIGEVNFGYNGSENFAKGKRFGFFPSVAAGWLLSEEKFMEPYKNTFSKIKFRISHGLVGNDNIGGRRFAYITTIENEMIGNDVLTYVWGVNNDYSRNVRREGDYGVQDLTWETVAKTNLGFELGLWNSLDFKVDFFKDLRYDIFMQRATVPASAGFIHTPWANYGKVENKGMDLSLDIDKQINTDLFINFRGTFTYAANKILEKDEPSTVVGTTRSSTGKPIDQHFGLIAEGLFTDADFADVENGLLLETIPTHTFGPVRPGDIKYKDISGDGMITDLDKTAIGGTVDPQIVYGFGANVRYKFIDFGFFFQGMEKTDRIIGGSYFIPGSGAGALGNIYSNVDDRWTVENPSQDVFWPRLTNHTNANNNQASTWWLKDMGLLRLRDVELGYSFPKLLISKAGIKAARLFVRGNNLLTFSSFDLWDPELNTSTGFRYPIMKSVSMGLTVNF